MQQSFAIPARQELGNSGRGGCVCVWGGVFDLCLCKAPVDTRHFGDECLTKSLLKTPLFVAGVAVMVTVILTVNQNPRTCIALQKTG